MRDDHRLDRRRVEVADGNHRHQVGAVPIRVELSQSSGADVLNDLRAPDRRAVRIARAFQQYGHLRIAQARLGAQTEPPFFEDDAALLLDLGGVKRNVVSPVFHDQQRPINDGAAVGRDLELIDRLVEARTGIHMRAEPHPERLDERGDVLPGKMPRTIEAHMLDEMRQAPLVIVLEHRAGVDHESQFGATTGLRVRPNEVLQAVGKPADPDLRVDGDDLGEWSLRRPAGRRRGLGNGHGGRSRHGGDREKQATHTCRHESFPGKQRSLAAEAGTGHGHGLNALTPRRAGTGLTQAYTACCRQVAFFSFQICSAGHLRAQATGTKSEYVVVACAGALSSTRSSTTNACRRKRRIHSPYENSYSTDSPSSSTESLK